MRWLWLLGAVACGDPTETDGTTDETSEDTSGAGENEVVVTTQVDGVETSWSCALGGSDIATGEIAVAGDTRRLRVGCTEMVGSIGMHMVSLIFERQADFAAGTFDIERAAGDTGSGDYLTVVLTDENGDGWQYITNTGTSGWEGFSGTLTLDEVGAAGGGEVHGAFEGSWTIMQRIEHSAPTGGPEARPGDIGVSFRFVRP